MKAYAKNKKTVLLYTGLFLILWTLINVLSMWWNIHLEKKNTLSTVTNIARSSFNKDQAYRQWASSHGGVYVKPTKKTPPNPWLSHIENRDVITNAGQQLTLMNPAYMVREMMDDFSELYGIKGRIVGIVYLNSHNKADSWETSAIRSFEKGKPEALELTVEDGEEYLRFMRPTIMKQSCQKCHGHLGFPNGSVRGGVSVSVPMLSFREKERESVRSIILTYLGIWILGFGGALIISKKALNHLRKREEEVEELIISSKVFNNTLDAIFITDNQGTILRVNKRFTDLTGYTEEEAVGEKPRILKSNYHDEKFYENLWKTLLTVGHAQLEIRNRTKNGEVFVSIQSISSIKDESENVKFFVSTMHDITDRKNAEERITHIAHYDPLTNLPNRALFKDRFSHAIHIAKRKKQKVFLAFLDLDSFKNINDTKGHPMGDKLLVEVGKTIQSCVRDSDTVSRLGGDEFTIIFEDLGNPKNIIRICNTILRELSEEIIIDDQSLFITGSIGLSVYPDDGEDIDTLIQHADTAMYKAKEGGRNCFNFYKEAMTVQAKERVELETSIKSALKNGEFQVYYQPKISLANGSVAGVEALVRWITPDGKFIPPDKFIKTAEEMHIVDQIDMYVLKTACRDLKKWIELGYTDIKVSINLSGYDIGQRDLFENVTAIVESENISPANIDFEITETFFMVFEEKNIDTLYKLKEYGFTMSIDDFGTGYSSLNSLRKLPVDTLKIDKTFISALDEYSENGKMIDMMIKLGHTFSLDVIAEGVETNEQLNYLREKNCDYIQGYLESRPLPEKEFIDYLQKKRNSEQNN